jgi:hypothetical protein
MSPARRVAIVQSSYVPWKGYLDLVNLADEFVLLDDVQYTRRDWRNRNRIKTADGLRWLTIPVAVKGRYDQRVQDVRVADRAWRRRHWRGLTMAYARAGCFERYEDRFRALYLDGDEDSLSAINRRFLDAVCAELRISTPISFSQDHDVPPGDASERLARLVHAVGGTQYVSGPTARAYLRIEPFRERGIDVFFMDYGAYPEYRQCHGPFEHRVSILDLLFNEGPRASRFMKSFSAVKPLVAAAP